MITKSSSWPTATRSPTGRIWIAKHNWVWGNLITRRSIRVAPTVELLAEPSGPRVPGA